MEVVLQLVQNHCIYAGPMQSASHHPTTATMSYSLALVLCLSCVAYGIESPVEGLEYVGCYRDTGNRAMGGHIAISDTLTTNQRCVSICASKGFAYAGTQHRRECWCDNSYDKYGPAENCNQKCHGDPAQMCGGDWALSVYRTERTATPPPTDAPTDPPTDAPTPAPVACAKQRKWFAENGLKNVEPTFNEDCTFKRKQCNDHRCYCVSARKGKRTHDNVEVPLGESFNCDSRLRACLKHRFRVLFDEEQTNTAALYVPECDKEGYYEPKQCSTYGVCWCVRKKSGAERKGTRGKADITC